MDKKWKHIIILCLLLLAFCSDDLRAQQNRQKQMIDSYAVEYLQTVNNKSPLYSGNIQEAHPRAKNHPYLVEFQYTQARLSYLGTIYPEAMLRLNLNRNELVARSPDMRNIVLFPENVDFAELHGQHIVYFRSDAMPGAPSSGYYALLHSGNCKILKKQNAVLNQSASQTTIEFYYLFSTQFYLFKDGVYQTIRNKRGYLNALQPYKKELKRFISANHLNYKKNTDVFLQQTINEFEKLSGLQ